MCKAFVKLPRPFGDQSGGARKWAIRDGCQTWFRDGNYHAPVTAPSHGNHTNKAKGGKSRSTGRSKHLAIGTGGDSKYGADPMSPSLMNNAAGPSSGAPWDPARSPLPWLQRFQQGHKLQQAHHMQQAQQHVDEQALIPRLPPQPIEAGPVHHGLVPSQYGQPQGGYNMAYAHAYRYGGGPGWGGAYHQDPGSHYPSPPEYGGSGSWRPPISNFGFNGAPFERPHRGLVSSDDDEHSNSRSHSQSSPGPERSYQFGEGDDYPKRETSTPLSSPPPGPDSGDA